MDHTGWAALALNTLVAVILVSTLCASNLKHPLTSAQATAGIAYVVAILTWVEAELGLFVAHKLGYSTVDSTSASSQELRSVLEDGQETPDEQEEDCQRRTCPVPGLSPNFLKGIRASAELSGIMILMYVCDRTDIVGNGPKHQSKLEFWGVFLALFVLSLTGLRRTKEADSTAVKPLQREQTEEWKGWMQVQFLLYHYWMAVELYNAIRIYIAAYIWMTGFGNFSYYYIKRDFGLPRFLQMMWRLNFLVIFVCLTLNNQYMLYYICPLHTLFTIMVFGTLYLLSERNQSQPVFLLSKMVLIFGISVLIWDVPGIFESLWAPFKPLLLYTGSDFTQFADKPMHEWHFRSHLDHLVWIFGMCVAYSFPRFDVWLNSLDNGGGMSVQRWGAIAAVVVVIAIWANFVFSLGKYDYNALHPYTSFIPIGGYIFLRNSTRWLRERVLPAWGEIGKYTLETYICQFHIWMRTTGENAQPKLLLVLIPGWFWLNFVVCTALYLYCSMRLFKITVALKEIVIPNDVPTIRTNLMKVAVGAAIMAALGLATHSCFTQQIPPALIPQATEAVAAAVVAATNATTSQ